MRFTKILVALSLAVAATTLGPSVATLTDNTPIADPPTCPASLVCPFPMGAQLIADTSVSKGTWVIDTDTPIQYSFSKMYMDGWGNLNCAFKSAAGGSYIIKHPISQPTGCSCQVKMGGNSLYGGNVPALVCTMALPAGCYFWPGGTRDYYCMKGFALWDYSAPNPSGKLLYYQIPSSYISCGANCAPAGSACSSYPLARGTAPTGTIVQAPRGLPMEMCSK
jgi:hypothetical protein